jgi:hypothetical protein
MAEAANNSLALELTAEAAAWRARVACWLEPGARLVHVSAHSSDVRLYRVAGRVLKLRRLTPAAVRGRPNTLEDEFQALQRLAAAGLEEHWRFPRVVRYHHESGWEALEMTAVEPPPMADPVICPFRETGAELRQLAVAVARLNLAGQSHGDLTAANAGLDPSGMPVLLDFDQAVAARPLRCLLRDFLGVPCANQSAQYSLWDRTGALHGFGWIRWPGRIRDWLRRRRKGFQEPATPLAQQAEIRGDPVLMALARCWTAAAASGASSPGAGVAYYSLDVRGFHLPGERPWPLRWEMLVAAVSFRGKRIVELGCNLGLLAIHARMAGGASVVAVDCNPVVIAAGRELAAICGVEVDFGKVDFDRDAEWEKRLGEGDLVTALSLTFWLQDKERLWRYLGRFAEVIFEGHEPAAEIENRFRQLGFAHVTPIGRSERSRVVFHACR